MHKQFSPPRRAQMPSASLALYPAVVAWVAHYVGSLPNGNGAACYIFDLKEASQKSCSNDDHGNDELSSPKRHTSDHDNRRVEIFKMCDSIERVYERRRLPR